MRRNNNPMYVRSIERLTQGRTEDLLPHLITELEKPFEPNEFEYSTRESLCELVASLGPKVKGVESTLLKLLNEPEPKINGEGREHANMRVSLCKAIWRVTGEPQLVLPALTEELTRPLSGWGTHELPSTGKALQLIGQIGEPATKLLPTLENMAANPRNPHERVATAEATWRLGASPDVLLTACIARLEEESNYLGLTADKIAVIGLLTEIGPPAKIAIPTMLRLAKIEADADAKQTIRVSTVRTDDEDPDPNQDRQFRSAVKSALERIDPAAVKDLDDLETNRPMP